MLLGTPREDRISLPGGVVYSIAKPVNDLLGLRDDDRYAVWLEHEWRELAPSRASIRKMLGPASEADVEAHLRDDLEAIARAASTAGGNIDVPRLALLLASVRYFEGEIEVPSLAALAAWALEHEARRRVDQLGDCPRCERPWFARPLGGNRLLDALVERPCSRPAPGLTLTCAQLDASDRFARERSGWSQEYRKIQMRRSRGSVTAADFRAWKDESKPGKRGEDWIPFDEWKARGGSPAPERD